MSAYDVEVIKFGSALHLADLEVLRERGLAIPHGWATRPPESTSGSSVWCRVVDPSAAFNTGFAVELSASWAIPGYRIGRVDRIGRELHAGIADSIGVVLRNAARKIPRLLRLEGRVFDEHPARRRRLSESFEMAGWSRRAHPRDYTQTLVLNLDRSKAALFKSFSRRLRNTIDHSLGSPALRFGPITGVHYTARIRKLHALPFARTGECRRRSTFAASSRTR